MIILGLGSNFPHQESSDYTIKRDLGHGLEIVERVHEEEGDLCEHCILEERKLEEARRVRCVRVSSQSNNGLSLF